MSDQFLIVVKSKFVFLLFVCINFGVAVGNDQISFQSVSLEVSHIEKDGGIGIVFNNRSEYRQVCEIELELKSTSRQSDTNFNLSILAKTPKVNSHKVDQIVIAKSELVEARRKSPDAVYHAKGVKFKRISCVPEKSFKEYCLSTIRGGGYNLGHSEIMKNLFDRWNFLRVKAGHISKCANSGGRNSFECDGWGLVWAAEKIPLNKVYHQKHVDDFCRILPEIDRAGVPLYYYGRDENEKVTAGLVDQGALIRNDLFRIEGEIGEKVPFSVNFILKGEHIRDLNPFSVMDGYSIGSLDIREANIQSLLPLENIRKIRLLRLSYNQRNLLGQIRYIKNIESIIVDGFLSIDIKESRSCFYKYNAKEIKKCLENPSDKYSLKYRRSLAFDFLTKFPKIETTKQLQDELEKRHGDRWEFFLDELLNNKNEHKKNLAIPILLDLDLTDKRIKWLKKSLYMNNSSYDARVRVAVGKVLLKKNVEGALESVYSAFMKGALSRNDITDIFMTNKKMITSLLRDKLNNTRSEVEFREVLSIILNLELEEFELDMIEILTNFRKYNYRLVEVASDILKLFPSKSSIEALLNLAQNPPFIHIRKIGARSIFDIGESAINEIFIIYSSNFKEISEEAEDYLLKLDRRELLKLLVQKIKSKGHSSQYRAMILLKKIDYNRWAESLLAEIFSEEEDYNNSQENSLVSLLDGGNHLEVILDYIESYDNNSSSGIYKVEGFIRTIERYLKTSSPADRSILEKYFSTDSKHIKYLLKRIDNRELKRSSLL